MSYLFSMVSLLSGTAILLVGHGLQLTLLPIRADAMGWSPEAIGLTGASYFSGFLAGCLSVPAVVARVGHIRVFVVLTAIATSALLGIVLADGFPTWMLLRFATGWAISGLYLVIESWLNEQAPDAQRGTVLSTYTVIVLVAMVVGQFALNLAEPTSSEIVAVGTLCLCLAAVPVGLSRSAAPAATARVRFSLREVFQTSRVGVGGALVAGMVTGAFFTLAPVLGRQLDFDVAQIAAIMSSGIGGGAVLQFPLGRLSDRVDRRRVILIAMVGGVGASLVGSTLDARDPALTLLIMFLLGGAMLPIYSLCLAHANDNASGNFLKIGTGILVMNAVGAILGPMIVSPLMGGFGPQAFFWCSGAFLGAGAVWTGINIRRRPALRPYFAPFTSTTETTQGIVQLDPRRIVAETSTGAEASTAPDGPAPERAATDDTARLQ